MALKNHSQAPATMPLPVNLADVAPEVLLRMRHDIDQILGIVDLADLNIEQEIIMQLQTAKVLQSGVMDDSAVPANQRAQTVNTVSNILIQLVKTQTELYNAERIKELESAIIQAMKGASDDVKDRFFERYERLLAAQGQAT